MEMFWCNGCDKLCEPKFWIKSVKIDTDFPFCSANCLNIWVNKEKEEA